jgi:hypothetical protein
LVKGQYHDFGPTLAAEYLKDKDGIRISKEALRQLLIEAGWWRCKRRRTAEVHVWRPRRSGRGELVQWDTSEHDWLEGRGPRLHLVAMVDDASSIAYGRFVRQDSTDENLRVLWGYLERWGRPVEFYTDRDSMFTVNRPTPVATDEAVPEELTQNRAGAAGARDRLDRRALAAGQGEDRALLRHGAGPAGERDAAGWCP